MYSRSKLETTITGGTNKKGEKNKFHQSSIFYVFWDYYVKLLVIIPRNISKIFFAKFKENKNFKTKVNK